MLDHVFTDAIGALRDAFEAAFLERQAFDEHFQVDVLLGDLSWETSYGLPGEGQPPRVVAHVNFDWPTWSQTSYRRWYVDEVLDQLPAIEMEIVFRIQRLRGQPDRSILRHIAVDTSPLIGDGRLERAGTTIEIAYVDPLDVDDHDDQDDHGAGASRSRTSGTDGASSPADALRRADDTDDADDADDADAGPIAEYAIEVTYEGLYELAEQTLADGSSTLLDEHFGALGGWIASTLVKLGDLKLEFLPADDE